MNRYALLAGTAAVVVGAAAAHATPAISFSTFVTSTDITAVEGYSSTIAFNYAGNKFVGSVYVGSSNDQLYSTNLTGGNVQKFGSPIPNGFSGEVVVGASLGQAGFPKGDIYAGAGTQIYHYANSGGSPTLFATVPDGATVRQVFFDPGSSFGGNMLVTTTVGDIYKINSSGSPTLVASIGADTEGMDIATSKWGPYAGDLLVSSEGTGQLHLVSPSGTVTLVPIPSITEAETVSFVPLNLNTSQKIEGFYVANYPMDIQFAAASNFTSLLGDAIVTSEEDVNSQVWEVSYDTATNTFSLTLFNGNLPNQSEDGIFVTPQRIRPFVPEPATLAILGTGLTALGLVRRRKKG